MTEDDAIKIIENHTYYNIVDAWNYITNEKVYKPFVDNKLKIIKINGIKHKSYLIQVFDLHIYVEEDLKNEDLWTTYLGFDEFILFQLAKNLKLKALQ